MAANHVPKHTKLAVSLEERLKRIYLHANLRLMHAHQPFLPVDLDDPPKATLLLKKVEQNPNGKPRYLVKSMIVAKKDKQFRIIPRHLHEVVHTRENTSYSALYWLVLEIQDPAVPNVSILSLMMPPDAHTTYMFQPTARMPWIRDLLTWHKTRPNEAPIRPAILDIQDSPVHPKITPAVCLFILHQLEQAYQNGLPPLRAVVWHVSPALWRQLTHRPAAVVAKYILSYITPPNPEAHSPRRQQCMPSEIWENVFSYGVFSRHLNILV